MNSESHEFLTQKLLQLLKKVPIRFYPRAIWKIVHIYAFLKTNCLDFLIFWMPMQGCRIGGAILVYKQRSIRDTVENLSNLKKYISNAKTAIKVQCSKILQYMVIQVVLFSNGGKKCQKELFLRINILKGNIEF